MVIVATPPEVVAAVSDSPLTDDETIFCVRADVFADVCAVAALVTAVLAVLCAATAAA